MEQIEQMERGASNSRERPASPGALGRDFAPLGLPLVWWGLLVAVSLAVRPAVPIDETRYLSVAWEMWTSGNFLVPHLNGVPYPDKPPLLFWLIHAGWAMFGVADWWPRIVPGLAGLAAMLTTAALARELWPEDEHLPGRAATVLQGSLLSAVLVTVLLFDSLVMASAVLADLGLVRAARRGRARDWVLAGLGIGLGFLAKGPVILVPVLPVMLAGPWWAARLGDGGVRRRPWSSLRWYGGSLVAFVLGLAIIGAWALPAASAGGEEYGNAILFGQTAGRVVSSFAHQKPWWWYLPLLPLVLFPYSLCPSLLRGVSRLRAGEPESGVRFAVAKIVPALVVFSLISGKQPQYLSTLLPAAALLGARLMDSAAAPSRRQMLGPMSFPLVLAAALAVVPGFAGHGDLPSWLGEISPGTGVLLAGATVLTAVLVVRRPRLGHRALGTLSVAVVIAAYVAMAPVLHEPYNLEPVADYLHLAEERERPVAYLGDYHGQFHFLGRLRQSFTELGPGELAAWFAERPDGLVITHHDDPGRVDLSRAELVHGDRGKTLAIWSRGDLDAALRALAGS